MTWSPPQHDPERELRDHLPAHAWREAAGEICARHGVDAGALHAFESGSDVVWGTGEFVVKLSAPIWAQEIAAEAHWLRRVAGRLSVETPRVHATGELSGWPYVVMSHVEGTALGELWPGLDHAARVRLAHDLGALTAELHALDGGAELDAWDPFWERCRTDVGARHTGDGVPVELAGAIDAFLERTGELRGEPRVLLHTELLDQHVLATGRAGRVELSALIDFADGRIGPAAYEFAAPVEFLFKGEKGLLRAFLLAYGYDAAQLTPERSMRMLAWALSHRFGRLRRMLAAAGPPTPRSLEELAQRLYSMQ